MRHALNLRRVLRWPALAASMMVLSSWLLAPQTSEQVLASPCFAIADDVVCMDEPVIVSMPPVTPSMLEPSRDGGEGSDEAVVFEDDGGYERTTDSFSSDSLQTRKPQGAAAL